MAGGAVLSGLMSLVGGIIQGRRLERAAAPYSGPGGAANTATANLLGVGGNPAASEAALNNYLNSTGYNFRLREGQRAITGSAAARGLLNSGSTARALTAYGQDLASQGFDNYLAQLGGLANRGLTATGLQSDAAASRASGFAGLATGIGGSVGNYLAQRRAGG